MISTKEGTTKLVPDKTEFMTAVDKIRYAAVRREMPLEVLDRLADSGTAMRDALGQGRGFMSTGDQWLDDYLVPMLNKATKSDRELGTIYATAQRGLEMAKWGKAASEEQINAWTKTIDDMRADPAKYQGAMDAAADLQGEYRRLLELLHRERVIDTKTLKALQAKGESYVPFKPAVMDQIDAWSAGGGTGHINRPNDQAGIRSLSKELNEETIVDPYEQLVQDVYAAHRRVARQRVANILSEIVPTAKKGVNPLKGLIEPSKPPRFEANKADEAIIKTIVNGKSRYYRIMDNDIQNAWSSFNADMYQDGLLKTANAMRKITQAGVTLNPVFGMKNAIRDFFMSGVQYNLGEGVKGLETVVQKFGQSRTLAGGAAIGAGIGAGTAEEGERVSGALKGAVAGASALGAAHMGAHAARTMNAMNDIMGPEAMSMIAGGMFGYTSGDETNSFSENMARFAVGAGVGLGAGKVLTKAGFGGDREQYKQFLREGGGQFGLYRNQGQRDPKAMLETLKRMGVNESDVLNPEGWGHAVSLIMHPIQAFNNMSRAIETAPRLAFHKRNMQKAGISLADRMSGGADPKIQRQVATSIYEARDLSLDFALKGQAPSAQAATATVPFLNPTLQGLDKLQRLVRDKGKVELAAATILAPSIGLWLMNHMDPETAQAYADRPDYEKNTYWLIPKRYTSWTDEEEGFYRVPKPFEVGHIFASIPERMMDAYFEMDDVAATAKAMNMMGGLGEGVMAGMSMFMRAPSPVFVGPSIQAFSGEHGFDWFTRRSIDPYPWRNVEPEDQQTPYTSTVAIWANKVPGLGDALAVLGFRTPAAIDFAINSYGATVGRVAAEGISRVARAAGWDERPEPIGQRRLFESTFHTRPTTSTQSELDFRTEYDRVEEAWNSMNDLSRRGENAEMVRRFGIGTEGDDRIAQYHVMRSFKNSLDQFTALRRQIRNDPNMPTEDREKAVVEINQAMSGIARMSNDAVRSVMGQRQRGRATE